MHIKRVIHKFILKINWNFKLIQKWEEPAWLGGQAHSAPQVGVWEFFFLIMEVWAIFNERIDTKQIVQNCLVYK